MSKELVDIKRITTSTVKEVVKHKSKGGPNYVQVRLTI